MFGMAAVAEAAQPAPQRAAAPAIPGMTSHFKLKTVEGCYVTETSFPENGFLFISATPDVRMSVRPL
jgi:hypothetical protein